MDHELTAHWLLVIIILQSISNITHDKSVINNENYCRNPNEEKEESHMHILFRCNIGVARILYGGALFSSKKLTTFLVVALKRQSKTTK